jgi:hypothetical protein
MALLDDSWSKEVVKYIYIFTHSLQTVAIIKSKNILFDQTGKTFSHARRQFTLHPQNTMVYRPGTLTESIPSRGMKYFIDMW